MDKVLTIVVPTYNMESLLENNLQTLIVNTEYRELLEVLIVIDGGTDRSSEIAHKFHDEYPSLFRVIDKENGNYGSCINRGLMESIGKYIRIMDADDHYDTRGLECQLDILKAIEVDVMFTDYCEINIVRDRRRIKRMTLPPNKILKFDEVMADNSFMDVQMHKITYRTENLRKIQYTQLEGISYTDQEWCYLPMTTVQQIYYLDRIVYYYMIGRVGQTVEVSTSIRNMSHLITIFFRMLEQYQNSSTVCSNNVLLYLYHRIEMNLQRIYTTCIIWSNNSKLPVLQAFDQKLKSNFPQLYEESEYYLTFQLNHVKYIKRWRRNRIWDRAILKSLRIGYATCLYVINRVR